jgi:flagellar hook-length control protein FliK
MEVSTIMSSVQMQQALTEISQFSEAANPQSNTQQSVRFSRLLEQCAGAGEGLGKSTDPFAAGLFSKAIADSLLSGSKLPEQQASDAGLNPAEQATDFLQATVAGEKGLTGIKVQSEPENDSGGYPQAEEQNEPDALPAGMIFPWAPLPVPGNNFIEANDAKPLAEPRAMEPSPVGAAAKPAIANGMEEKAVAPALLAEIPAQEGKTESLKPGNPLMTDQGRAIPVPAGRVTFQENTATEGQRPELNPDLLVKEASEGTSARNLTKAATSPNPEVSVSDPESAATNRPSILRESSLYRDIFQAGESNPEADAGSRGKILKQGTNGSHPQPEAVSNAGGEVPLPRTLGQNAGSLEIPARKTVATVPEQAGAIDTPLPGENRRGGETAVNAYRAVSAEGAAQGRKGAPLFPADIRPSTTQALQEPDAVNSGEAPRLIDIVFAEKGKSLPGGAAGEVAGKGVEVGSAAIETPAVLVQGQGELRTNGEFRMLSPANDAKAPSPGQIQHQVREKLESGDYGLNKGNITLKLHPEELGELKINLRMEEHRLKIEIVTENQSVKEALMQNLDSLKETLSRQNIAMDRFNVSTDIRQGFQQGARDERQLTQGSRGTGAASQPAAAGEESALPGFHYGWENDNSLVSLVL